ncbi:MAG: MoaD/ThiS family protein [Chloroflexia bacterium]|nr:MoaD/ThiS family protein [Chloroflexia bacterium]
MQVQVRLYATLRQYAPHTQIGEPVPWQLPPGSSVAELIAQLPVPDQEVKRIFVNHRAVKPDHLLQDGDRVSLFPLVAGG